MKIFALIFSMILMATVTVPGQTPGRKPAPTSAYGVYPIAYKEIITRWLEQKLHNPGDYQLKWLTEPKPGELKGPKGEKLKGYYVEFTVNARNIFGGFTGAQKHGALILNGDVIRATGFGYH